MTSQVLLHRHGLCLAGLDFGGAGARVLLLHGLAGHAAEWTETAGRLTRRSRVVALDARGHGRSERYPVDVSREAHVADVVFALERLRLGPAVLVGQSLGGQTALLVAAGRPDLLRGLVIADASPPAADETEIADVGEALRGWPVPFGSREEAVDFFGGTSLRAGAWADGLEHRDRGWWPRFDVDVMVRTLREAESRSYWQEWEQISCPTLVVRAGNGIIPVADAKAMTERLPQARLVELDGAGHDLHLDRPAEWRMALSEFLDSLD